eukprot:736257-Rhodomonas_salina.4
MRGGELQDGKEGRRETGRGRGRGTGRGRGRGRARDDGGDSARGGAAEAAHEQVQLHNMVVDRAVVVPALSCHHHAPSSCELRPRAPLLLVELAVQSWAGLAGALASPAKSGKMHWRSGRERRTDRGMWIG